MALKGACLCGSVRFEIDAEPALVGHCHCTRCQRTGGGGSQTVAGVPHGSLRFVAGEELVTTYAEEGFTSRNFCSRCGSQLYGTSENLLFVSAGALDPSTQVQPQFHIMVDFKAPWDEIGGDLPQFGEYPPMG